MRTHSLILATCFAAMVVAAPEATAADREGHVTVSDTNWSVEEGTWPIGPGPESVGRFNSIDVDGDSVTLESLLGAVNNYGGEQFVTLTYDWGALPRRIVGVSEPVVERDAERNGRFQIDGFTDNSVTFLFQGDWGPDGIATFELQTEPLGTSSERLEGMLDFVENDLADAVAEVVRGDAEGATALLDSAAEYTAAMMEMSQEDGFGDDTGLPSAQVVKLCAKIDRAVAKARRATAAATPRKLRAAQRIVKVAVLIDKMRARLDR